MDTDEQPEPQPYAVPDALAHSLTHSPTVSFSQPGVAPTDPDAFTRSDLLRVTVTDANGAVFATGTATITLDSTTRQHTVRFADPEPAVWGRRLLPVRPQCQPHPDSYAHPDVPAGTDPDAFVHTHRHAHRARPGDALASSGLLITSYTHAHRHAHPGDVPDDRTYHRPRPLAH